MALVWIVTTGNSDFKVNRKDGFLHLRTAKNKQLKPCQKKFSDLLEGDDNLFSLPARVMGIIYGDVWEDYKDYFRFPLLEEFVNEIKRAQKNLDRIIVLLTNQEEIFLEDSEDPQYDRCEDSPYWRDTCCLESIFKHYFDREFGKEKTEFIYLSPTNKEEGLDNWDAALKLVQEKFKNIKVLENDSILVSHQAGTPAISSAVQFASLAKFGSDVFFLISNERDKDLTRFSPGSEYLKGIRKKEVEALLRSYNYAGVEDLIEDYVQENEDIKTLLGAAKNWNVARFTDFRDCLEHYPKFASEVAERTREENWWWIAYEEVYLAIIRKNQDNIVEAFFHSFRAFEGIFASWGHERLSQHIETIKGIPYLCPSILDDSKNAFLSVTGDSKDAVKDIKLKLEQLKEKIQNNVKITKDDRVEMNLRTLCNLFKAFRYSDYRHNCQALKIFWDNDKDKNVSDKRNFIVHQVQGMNDEDLNRFWGVNSWDECQTRLREFLNFIVREDFPEGFATLEVASLMAKVHEALEKEIAAL